MAQAGFMNSVSRAFHNIGFQIQKHSPEILAVAGVVGIVASTVMACKATTKINDVLEEAKDKIDLIHECEEHGCTPMGEEYTPERAKKDLTIAYVKTGLEFAKLYGPSVVLGTLSITSMLASNNILRQRTAAYAAAYATVDSSFKNYRNEVIERFGKDLDRELKYGIKTKEVEETVTDENGEEKTVTKTVQVVNPDAPSDYSFFFDDGCIGWEKDAEHNLTYVNHMQNYFNEILQARGHVYLNEVYDAFGVPRTRAGQVVGWLYNKNGEPNGDGYIDFGVFNVNREANRRFVNGLERVILIEPNVDGDIWSLMKDRDGVNFRRV